MKCPRCNGDGSVPYHVADDLFDETNCDLCGGSGEVMTNEEWFCQLPTEEKAVIFSLLSYRCNICDGTPTNQCPFDRCVRGVKDIIKWLKQPHKPIS